MGELQDRYRAVHPAATTALDLCRFFEEHPDQWFTFSELKGRVGCGDRTIRERVPEALNGREPTIEVDTSQCEWRYRYRRAGDVRRGDRSSEPALAARRASKALGGGA